VKPANIRQQVQLRIGEGLKDPMSVFRNFVKP